MNTLNFSQQRETARLAAMQHKGLSSEDIEIISHLKSYPITSAHEQEMMSPHNAQMRWEQEIMDNGDMWHRVRRAYLGISHEDR
jgi:hypothetical protein